MASGKMLEEFPTELMNFVGSHDRTDIGYRSRVADTSQLSSVG